MEILIFIVLFAVIGVPLLLFVNSKEQKKDSEAMQKAIDAQKDFNATKTIKGENYGICFNFAIDDDKQEIYCYSKCRLEKNAREARFKFKNIVEVEIKVDGDTTISKKSASLGGAVVGGMIAGGLGAVVGGSSLGKTTSKKEVSSIDVHILLRDCPIDSFDVKCLPYSCKTDDYRYKESIANAQKIFDALRLAMDKVKETPSIQPISPKSDVEELKELANLKNQGIITDEEFSVMKAKILNR